METNEIVSALMGTLPDPSEVVFAITMQDLVAAIVRRIGEGALMLTPNDLLLAREEVQASIGHNLDEREFIDIGLDSWEISKNLEVTRS
ncbi:hypothetical protein [Pelotalea chapellei]|uniref:Uncharacterized protein n=1 Tax=Pelotalea chapellei TaxID=44671 RepID=A0ABS5UCQ3_9BACT|nr:hypothetical protein [Pelotalea chapellei]MBT1073489.1 hypothetical protein [Pelotalea chapellei]